MAKVCTTHNVASIEAMPYGKGYVEAQTFWRQFFDSITALRDARGMTVIMIAHSQVQRVEDPTLPAYDRHGLKLHKRASALAEEFADVVLYAAMQTNTITEDSGFNNKRTRATTTGERVMHTVGQPAFLCQVLLLASLATAADLGSVRTGHAAGCACSQSGFEPS